jgi:hypothetical protein
MRAQLLSVAINDINDITTAVLFVDKITDGDAAEALTADFKAVAADVMAAVPAGAEPTIQFALARDDDMVRLNVPSRWCPAFPLTSGPLWCARL